jgi:hypothetical protein
MKEKWEETVEERIRSAREYLIGLVKLGKVRAPQKDQEKKTDEDLRSLSR